MRILAIVALQTLFLTGCASYPETVRVSDETNLVSYQSATQGAVSQGTARWSGIIAKVQNQSADTRLEVVFFPSQTNGRPRVSDETQGRFVAYVNGFLDPMVYQQGKSITVLGQLRAAETGMVDQYTYVYPVIQQATIHLWPKQAETRVDVEPWPVWRSPFHPYWGYGPAIRIRTTTQTGEKPTQGPINVDKSKGSQQR